MKIASGLLTLGASLALVALSSVSAIQDPANSTTANSTTTSNVKKLYTYAGPLLPHDWTLVSILNDRVVIGFENGTARNSLMFELNEKDRTFVQRLQNGTLVTTPLASAKEKLTQWSSTVSSTVSKFGKSVRDQFDSFINSDKNKNSSEGATNITMLVN